MSNATGRRWAGAVAVSLLAVGLAPIPAVGTRVTEMLSARSCDPSARGRATLALKETAKGRFRVLARGLEARSMFDLMVDDVRVASLRTNGAGSGKIKLSTHPKRSDALLGFDPRGKTIAVRNDRGDDCLVGTMPGSIGGSPAGAFPCCSSADGGLVDCEVETPEVDGTTLLGIESCIPNPCGPSPENGVVCCFPGSVTGAIVDGAIGTECQDVGAQQCAQAGGTVVEADSCTPNPCVNRPPPGLAVCCLPDDDNDDSSSDDSSSDDSSSEGTLSFPLALHSSSFGERCRVLTFEACSVAGGAPSDAASCASNPCDDDDSGQTTQWPRRR